MSASLLMLFCSQTDNESSPISAIFRGQICSILHQLGQKESATLQSFFTLQLDVQVSSIQTISSLQSHHCVRRFSLILDIVE